MVQTNGSTRDRLVRAAEKLFAERGTATVSLREINREAMAKNSVAVQYHFSDRAGVLQAIVAKHWPPIDAARHALLDEYEASGANDPRALAAALVRPLAAKLSDRDGGPEFLQIYAEMIGMPRDLPPDRSEATERVESIQRWRTMVEPFLGHDAARLHRRFTAMRFTASELGRRASTAPHTDDRLFVSHLIDLVTALLVAPTSEETIRLADARDASRSAGPPPVVTAAP